METVGIFFSWPAFLDQTVFTFLQSVPKYLYVEIEPSR